MLDIFAEPEGLASECELLLDGFKGRDEAGWAVGAEEIPGVKAGEILESAEEFITTDCRGLGNVSPWSLKSNGRADISTSGCDEAEVMGHGWMVDECVCSHDSQGSCTSVSHEE